MHKAFKYRLWTNANQERELSIMLETHRHLYNACLEQRKTAYETEKKSVRYTDQSSWFTSQRATNPYFGRLNFSSAQATMRRLDKAFQNFFRRVKNGRKPGYPRFKARGRFESIEFPAYGDGIRLIADRLRVQHVGVIRVKLHRLLEGTVKTATLKLENDKWFVILSCELPKVQVQVSPNPPVGIDMGIESFLTTDQDVAIANPRFLKNELPALRRVGRAVSRKKRGGNNRRKAIKRLRRLHVHVRNLRREHHHQTSLKLIRRHGLIAVERLAVSNMVKNRRLARAISDAGWSAFLGILRYKAESAGVEVIEVDPAWTSQLCSACGCLVEKPLSQRWHSCACGLSTHRDTNAARNILARALQARTGPVGVNGQLAVA